jgi:tetratricopeptide (TPR) repeat protein
MRTGTTTVTGRLPPESIARIVRQNMGRFRGCYSEGLNRNPKLRGRVVTDFVIARDGSVATAVDAGSNLSDARVVACIVEVFKDLRFAEHEDARITVRYPLQLAPRGELVEDGDKAAADEAPTPFFKGPRPLVFWWPGKTPDPSPDPWTGVYAETRSALATGDPARALSVAKEAHARRIDDVGALLALGEAFEAARLPGQAARAYGSIADIYPHRADMLRVAGGRLAALGGTSLSLAIELLRRAQGDRPDQPSSYQLLAMAWLAAGRSTEALATLDAAAEAAFPARYVGAARLFREERAFIEALEHGEARPPVAPSFAAADLDAPATLVVATWESDASEVAIGAVDAEGNARWPATIASSDGFGPNAGLLIDPSPGLRFGVRLERRGPTGDAFGLVHVLTHDGHGHVRLRTRPFALMTEGATVSL